VSQKQPCILARFCLPRLTAIARPRFSPRLLSDVDSALVRAISRTLSKTFWIPWREPHVHDRYDLRGIVADLRASSKSCVQATVVFASGNVRT
jgi:hypothetical protein